MKKAFLFAFAACCAFAAQAVTASWTGSSDGSFSRTPGQSFSLIWVGSFTTETVEGTAGYSEVKFNNSNTYKWGFRSNGGNIFVANINGDKANTALGDSSQKLEANKPYSLAFTAEATSTNTYTITFYCNGEQVYTQAMTGATGISVWMTDSTEAAFYDTALTAEQIAWCADNNTATVPEPTALALLALGVAGLALKRKVA